MADEHERVERASIFTRIKANWGSLLFYTTLIVLLVFFWWLLIYSGGTTIQHG